MTKQHFIRMAAIVRAILDGEWTHNCPSWAREYDSDSDMPTYDASTLDSDSAENLNYTRAVQTAEAFIALATDYNPRFDTQRFLVACGLADKPKRAKRP